MYTKPKKPMFSKGLKKYLIGATGVYTFYFIISACMDWETCVGTLSSLITLVLLTVLLPLAVYVLFFYCPAVNEYNLAEKDFGKYQERRKSKALKEKHMKEEYLKSENERLAKLPECPICNSKRYVKRISTLDRDMSVTMFGLASSKIGKQYECKNCKHKW